MNSSLILGITILATSVAFGQTPDSSDQEIEARIIAIETEGWNAWKNRDIEWFEKNTVEEVIWITSDGITDKTQYLKALPTGCEVTEFSLDDFKFGMKSRDMVVMTYTALQDAKCDGNQIPARIRASVVYVKRDGKWLEALYMETPLP